jgi:hypothetical protein
MSSNNKNSRLPNRRRAFIHHYIQTWNATDSARKAGYKGSDEALASMGSYLLRNPKVQAAIRTRLQNLQLSADEVLARLQVQATSDLSPFIRTTDSAGNPCKAFVDVDALIKAGKGCLIREIGYTKTGEVVVKTFDQQKALELLGRAQALFRDKTEITGKDGEPLFKSFVGIDPEKV